MHLVHGELLVNERHPSGSDAVLLASENRIGLCKGIGAEVLVFDLDK